MAVNKVVLLDRVGKLGGPGDIVSVKGGYARNYLIPHKRALYANKASISYYEQMKVELEKEVKARVDMAVKDQKSLEGKGIDILVKASQDGKIFGSISTKDLAQKINDSFSMSLTKGQIVLLKPIKMVGIYDVVLRLYSDYEVIISCCVAQDQEMVIKLREELKKKSSLEENPEQSNNSQTDSVVSPTPDNID